jgi:hypothetical protein
MLEVKIKHCFYIDARSKLCLSEPLNEYCFARSKNNAMLEVSLSFIAVYLLGADFLKFTLCLKLQ